MCGICGIFRSDSRPIDADRVLRMRDAMVPRGPDGCGLECGPGFALGHRRLSIIDLSTAASQPMTNEDGGILIVFNGEIYNFGELRPQLERAGHQFRSQGDTEALIHGYEEWGLGRLLERIRGMYAFAIVDRQRNELHLARDPLGKKPLFYRFADGECAFASSARALSLGLDATPDIDPCAIDTLIWNSYIPGTRTIFLGVQKLLPGRALSIGQDGSMHEIVHWQPDFFHPDAEPDAESWLDKTEETLRTAVARRFVADVPVGVMLSGGVNSSLVTALAATQISQVSTFCVSNENPLQDESDYALAVARKYGTRHHVLPVRSDIRKDLVQLVAAMGEPMTDLSAANMFAIAKMARESVTVVLTGDGGDEGFGGYTEAWAFHLADRIWRSLPSSCRAPLATIAELLRKGPKPVRRAGTLLRLASHSMPASLGSLWPTEAAVRNSLYSADFRNALKSSNPLQHIYDALTVSEGYPWSDRFMQMQVLTRLADEYLPKVDLATMGASLEARCPFLDLDVVNLAMHIPETIRFSGREPKGLLRRLARRYIPAHAVNRRKQGFTIPIELWLRRDWAGIVNDLILGSHVERRGWFQRNALERIVAEHRQGRNNDTLLWTLLILELWVRLVVDKTIGVHDCL